MDERRPDALLRRLGDAGYEAYYVGGCVRDGLLSRPIHDWDVASSALPEQVMALFDRCIPTGLRHGTVTVLYGGTRAEVTTFRADGGYQDGRHPDSVRFVGSVQDDLARRDFTINAMAADANGRVLDLYGGRADLAQGVIRCVGDPEARFREDALRMLRAYRFAAQLGFRLDTETERACLRCAPLCRVLSPERVRDETEKTLLSDRPALLEQIIRAGLLRSLDLTDCGDLSHLAQLPALPAIRWAALLQAVPELQLERFRLPRKTVELAKKATAVYLPSRTPLAWKQLIAAQGWAVAETAAALSGEQQTLEAIRASGDCVSLRQLVVNGRDFPNLQGAQIAVALQRLLAHVLEFPDDNRRELLLARIENQRET